MGCQRAKLCARIKPTALCSVFDKENLIEFPLDSVHYLYMKSNPNPSFCPTDRDQREFDLETRVITNENIMDL